MERTLKIDLKNPIVRIPAEFLKQFKTHPNKKYVKATMIYANENILSKESITITVEK